MLGASVRALCAFSIALIFVAAPLARAEVKVGDVVTATNAEQVRALLSPGAFVAVAKGMQMNIVATGRIDWPPPYQNATEKYASQVQLAPDHRDLLGYVAGQPFPILDVNDPNVATNIIWNQYFNPITTDDFHFRYFESQVAPQNPG